MASGLSDEEFQRMQEQLIELRTRNYTLEDSNRKNRTELKQVQDRVTSLEDELNRANKTINKSKKIKEVESIISENESLLRKLEHQEDEFRLQNSTIMQELSSVISANEKFEKQIAAAEEKDAASDSNASEIIRLQAENTVLQKNLSEMKEKYESKVSDAEMKSFGEGGATRDYAGLALQLEMKNEEFKMMKEHFDAVNKNLNESRQELSKVSEKLKKKQESILQLQKEKEDMFSEHTNAIDELIKSKSEEISQLKDMTCRLQTQLNNALDATQDQKSKTAKYIAELEHKCDQLQNQIAELSSSDPEKMKVLEEEAAKLKTSAETAWIERDNQVRALKEALANCEVQTRTIQMLEKAKGDVESREAEAVKLAEKRKTLLDQMAVHLQSTTDKHSEELHATTGKLNSTIEELKTEIETEKKKTHKIEKMKKKLDSSAEEVKSLESTKSWLERRLLEAEEDSKQKVSELESLIEELKQKNADYISVLNNNHEKHIQDLNVQLEMEKVQKNEFEDIVTKLKQEAKDSVEDRKIREKKGVGIVKDLKRQLHAERRQVEKLQERLQEVLSEANQSRTSVEELLSGDQLERRGDNGSVGSWSLMSGGTADHSNTGKEYLNTTSESICNDHSPDKQLSETMDTEHQELISRLAHVQQQKWDLEEKLNHLEISNSAMAEDLMSKSAIIHHYCMERRPDPQHIHSTPDKLTVKRVVDFIKDKGDENLRDINRKLQRMLEETLTKNMHLQKNMETLTHEIEESKSLSQEACANA